MQMFRLVYHSKPAMRMSGRNFNVMIADVLSAARKNNPALGITGGLLFTSKYFIQVLEGDMKTVKELAAKISKDPRHNGFRVLYYDRPESRWFGDWSMAHVKLASDDFNTLDAMLATPDLLPKDKVDVLADMMISGVESGEAVCCPLDEEEAFV